MAWASLAYGTTSAIYNAACTPAIPGSPPAGTIAILQTGMYIGTATGITIPGWTALTTGSGSQGTQQLFGRKLTGTGDTPSMPSWGAVGQYAWINTYSGGTLNISGTPVGNASNLIGGVNYGSMTQTDANCLLIAFGMKDTAQSSAAVSAFGSFTVQNTFNQQTAGVTLTAVYNDWIQTSPTSVSTGAQTISPSDGVSEPNVGWLIALLPFVPNTAGIAWVT